MESEKYLCWKSIQVGSRSYKAGEDTINKSTYSTLTPEQQESFKPFPGYLDRMEKERDSQFKINTTTSTQGNSWDDLAGR